MNDAIREMIRNRPATVSQEECLWLADLFSAVLNSGLAGAGIASLSDAISAAIAKGIADAAAVEEDNGERY